MKRYVIFFTSLTKGRRRIMTRLAKGPTDAYRKATGWKGRVAHSNGYCRQYPARMVCSYIPFGEEAPGQSPPPRAFIVPLGVW